MLFDKAAPVVPVTTATRGYALTIDAATRRMRRRIRSRLLTSDRTATRTFDLQLAIATLRPKFMSRLDRMRTIPVVYGGNRAGPF